MKTIGVTGGSGFIGLYVVETLISKGYKVIIFDRQKKKHDIQADIFLGDVRNETDMMEFAAHCDGIIHLAACLGTQETIQNPKPAADTNIFGGINFLEAVTRYKIPGVNICVGNHFMNNTYSITKTTVERLVYMYNSNRKSQVNNVRVVNAYGPRQLAAAPFGPGKVRKIFPAFICRALSSMPIEVYGNGGQISDCVYVSDVANVLVKALECANQNMIFDCPIEVGLPEHTTVNNVAELVNFHCNSQIPIKHLPMRPGETENSVVTANYTTLKLIDIDVGNFISLNEGIKRTVQYFKNTKGSEWFIPKSNV